MGGLETASHSREVSVWEWQQDLGLSVSQPQNPPPLPLILKRIVAAR